LSSALGGGVSQPVLIPRSLFTAIDAIALAGPIA
jgi:hypothetical protein